MPTSRGLKPPSDHSPGAVLARNTGPAPRGALALAGLCLPAAGWLAGRLTGQAPGSRAEPVAARQLDTVAVDTHGVAVRCGGRAPFRYPWSQVRRLDAGAGRSAGWLRLWLVDGVPAPACLPARRRTSEGALLVLEFGDGADRETVGEAVRRYVPLGVRVRL